MPRRLAGVSHLDWYSGKIDILIARMTPPRKNEQTYEDDRWCVHVKISSTETFDFPPHDIMIYTSNFHHPSRTTKVTASQLPKLPLRSPCKWCINSLLSILPSFLAFQRSWRFARWLMQKKMNSRNRCLHKVTDEYYIYTTNIQVHTILRTHEMV